MIDAIILSLAIGTGWWLVGYAWAEIKGLQ